MILYLPSVTPKHKTTSSEIAWAPKANESDEGPCSSSSLRGCLVWDGCGLGGLSGSRPRFAYRLRSGVFGETEIEWEEERVWWVFGRDSTVGSIVLLFIYGVGIVK